MIRAIAAAATAAVGVADEPLDDPGVAPADARLRSGRDALLVGAAQKPLNEAEAIEQPAQRAA